MIYLNLNCSFRMIFGDASDLDTVVPGKSDVENLIPIAAPDVDMVVVHINHLELLQTCGIMSHIGCRSFISIY